MARVAALMVWIGLALPPASVSAQASVMLDRLHGEWHGTGTMLGRPVTQWLAWQSTAGFATAHLRIRRPDATASLPDLLSAASVYRDRPGQGDGAWLDSRGERAELGWMATDSTLEVEWTFPAERGRTTYTLRGQDILQVTDEVQTATGWRTFGQGCYRRGRAGAAPVTAPDPVECGP